MAAFTPANPGGLVLAQQRTPGGWRTIKRLRETRRGSVIFSVVPNGAGGRPLSYRAVSVRGARRVATSPASVGSWAEIFSDEFDGRRLDTSKWEYRLPGALIESRTRSASAESAVGVGRGTLNLSVRPWPGRRGYFHNGHVGTEGAFAFRYGVAAARMRFPRGQGQHGSFWSQPYQPQDAPGNPALDGAEIDVAEWFGAGRRKGGLAHYVYFRDADGEFIKTGDEFPSTKDLLSPRDDWWKSYHVYSVEWTPRRYIFRIDGVETWRTTRGISRQQQYLILSLLTSDWELPKLDRTSLPTTMRVDWVRAWQQN
jgi:beta-glucanase (GH16 family)